MDVQDAYLHVPILLRSRRFLGFWASRSIIPVSGFSPRSSRLPLGVLALDSHRRCLAETERDQNILLLRRLVVSGEVKDSVGIPASDYLSRDSDSGFLVNLEK